MAVSVSWKLSRRFLNSASSSSLRRCSCSSASLSWRRRASRSANKAATDRLRADDPDMAPYLLRILLDGMKLMGFQDLVARTVALCVDLNQTLLRDRLSWP